MLTQLAPPRPPPPVQSLPLHPRTSRLRHQHAHLCRHRRTHQAGRRPGLAGCSCPSFWYLVIPVIITPKDHPSRPRPRRPHLPPSRRRRHRLLLLPFRLLKQQQQLFHRPQPLRHRRDNARHPPHQIPMGPFLLSRNFPILLPLALASKRRPRRAHDPVLWRSQLGARRSLAVSRQRGRFSTAHHK